jgi:hypothetical protein
MLVRKGGVTSMTHALLMVSVKGKHQIANFIANIIEYGPRMSSLAHRIMKKEDVEFQI